MSYIRVSIKNNSQLLTKKPGYFDIRSEYLEAAKRASLNLKKATPQQLREIRKQVAQKRKKQVLRNGLSLALALVFTGGIIYAIQEGVLLLMQ